MGDMSGKAAPGRLILHTIEANLSARVSGAQRWRVG